MAIGIYKITNKQNGKVYIGQSRNIASRWYQHKLSAQKPKRGDDHHFVSALKKYGADEFTFEVLEKCKVEELNDREIYWIAYYNSTNENIGYNYQIGGKRQQYVKNVTVSGKLTLSQVEEITQHLLDAKISQAEIARRYDLHKSAISNINVGKTWVRDNIDYPIRKNIIRREVPSKEELIQMLYKHGYVMTYRKLNTHLATLKRWCHQYEIPDNLQEFSSWYSQNYNK